MVSIHVLATPISGRLRSSSVNPIALNMDRAPARSRPSVIPRLMCLRSMAERVQERKQVSKFRVSSFENRDHLRSLNLKLETRNSKLNKKGNPLCRFPQLHDVRPGIVMLAQSVKATRAPQVANLPALLLLEYDARSTKRDALRRSPRGSHREWHTIRDKADLPASG